MKVNNVTDINLPLAVWLLHDEYDYINEPNYISATSLMRPLKQIILAGRVPKEGREMDVSENIARALGHTIHSGIELAWSKGNHRKPMQLLGYPDTVIDRILVNPADEEVAAMRATGVEPILIFMEQRQLRQLDGYTIGGKYDLVADGIPQDNKSTSAWTWVFGTRDEDHRLQISIYRWLDAVRPSLGLERRITEDYCVINYIFTDWAKMQAKTNPKYPQKRIEHKRLNLLSLEETEMWLATKLALVRQYKDQPESAMPECTDEELWRSDPVWKYYSTPEAMQSGGKATKNFDNAADARAFMASKGGKGAIKHVPGEVKACGYCPAFDVCTQKDRYFS